MFNFRLFLRQNILRACEDIMHDIFTVSQFATDRRTIEQSMKAYEAETKLIRAKWMINEIKDMVEDKSSRQDVIDFIEQCSKDFEI